MHLAFAITIIIISWKWADWRNWQKYHATLIFVAMGNLLYKLLYGYNYLWQLRDGILQNTIILDALYTFIILPMTTLLFLTNYPGTIKGQILRNTRYIAAYIILEWIFYKYGMIVYNNGWNIWWSLAWDFMMFPVWALHYKKPLTAYGVSLIVIAIVITLFPVIPSKPA